MALTPLSAPACPAKWSRRDSMAQSKTNPAQRAAGRAQGSDRPDGKINSQHKSDAKRLQCDRERIVSVLRLAQAAGDYYHAQALRLVLKGFDDRLRAAR